MAKKPESRLQRRIRHALEKTHGGFWRKQHGGPFSAAGLPDLLGYVSGVPFQLEIKRDDKRSKPTLLQLETILSLRANGVVADIVTNEEDAIDLVTYHTQSPFIRLSGEGLQIWSTKKIRGIIDGTRNGEDTRSTRDSLRKVRPAKGTERPRRLSLIGDDSLG